MIRINELTKKYGDVTALNKVTFSIPDNSICALVGPNGAGKSTCLKILARIMDYDSGEVNIDGMNDLGAFRRQMGYLPEQRGLYSGVDIESQLHFFARIRGVKDREAKENANILLRRFGIETWRHRRISELSKGMQQKVQLLSCLISHPRLLFMDEPFTGVDPINFLLFVDIIKEYRAKYGATIILSTHNMKSVESLCSDVVMLNKGQVAISGKVNDVKESYMPKNVYVMELAMNGEPTGEEARKVLSVLGNIKKISAEKRRVHVELTTAGDEETLLRSLAAQASDYHVLSFARKIPTMEEIFVNLGRKENNYE